MAVIFCGIYGSNHLLSDHTGSGHGKIEENNARRGTETKGIDILSWILPVKYIIIRMDMLQNNNSTKN